MTSASTDGAHESVNPLLVRKYDRSGPRYTSYPTADRFIAAYNGDSVKQWLASRDVRGNVRSFSLYVHIPFCKSICYYCACNKIATKDQSRARRYLEYLEREIDMYRDAIAGDIPIEQMHWGGGTPTFLTLPQIDRLTTVLHQRFNFKPGGEYSIEVDPRTVDADFVSGLGTLGFNRMSIGVQDFEPDVQKAINRKQTKDETFAILDSARRSGFRSINMDLIYGLPKQTVASFNHTLDLIVEAMPDRIALYNYAHLPQRFKPQRRIHETDLPSADDKLQIFALAVRKLGEAGYQYIGMDHFALADDDLCIAQRQGRLHRNFQGYSTHIDSDLIGLGASAIGAIGPAYYQNFRSLDEYYDSIDRNSLPVMHGLALTADDLVRRAVIQALMCNFSLSMEAIEVEFLIDFAKYFSVELGELKAMEKDGLVRFEDDALLVTNQGRFLVRNICMVFDRYLRERDQRAQYSKVI